MKIVLNPFRRSPAKVVVQAAPPPVVVRVDPTKREEWQAARRRKEIKRAELAQEIARLDAEIAELTSKIG